MYEISNRTFEDLINILDLIKTVPCPDVRTLNKVRRAAVIAKKLRRQKKKRYERD